MNFVFFGTHFRCSKWKEHCRMVHLFFLYHAPLVQLFFFFFLSDAVYSEKGQTMKRDSFWTNLGHRSIVRNRLAFVTCTSFGSSTQVVWFNTARKRMQVPQSFIPCIGTAANAIANKKHF